MEYIILALVGIIVVFLFLHNTAKLKSQKNIDKIRQAWGQTKTNSIHFGSVTRYADQISHDFHRITYQTIHDIDFHQVFNFIDCTTSKVGQQFLYHKLTAPANNSENQSERLIQLFTSNKDLREEIQLELLKLSDHDAYYIPSLLSSKLPVEPKWHKFLILDVVLVISLIISSLKFPWLLIILLLPIILNMFLHLDNKNNTSQFVRSIPQLSLLIQVSNTISKKGGLLDDDSVTKSIANMKSFQWSARFIRFNHGEVQADFAQYFFEIVKVIFLIEVFMFFKVMRELKEKRSSVLTLFNYVGNIDASISIASLRAGKLKTCQPVFTEEKKEIIVKNLYHPLIPDCVENSLSIINRSILITGSNMSGKSTFLRTLAINSILAQTIFTCFADEFISPILKQFSSIRIADNLFEGKSYFFKEVDIMKSFVVEVARPQQNLFVLDEVFKGTNTIERISTAKAILSFLNQNTNIVLVSTHDVELTAMLKGEFDLYHFAETIENGKLHFDHRIKKGPVTTRNAIKLLELSNFPPSVVNEAQQISETFGAANSVKDE